MYIYIYIWQPSGTTGHLFDLSRQVLNCLGSVDLFAWGSAMGEVVDADCSKSNVGKGCKVVADKGVKVVDSKGRKLVDKDRTTM